ncbi:hypothetical protein KVV02_006847 [Mortierella alpina]|uniref:CSD domain-containing protein n=1 Tax=Mortierella alpina TaxID=64518 RepID=A0A9P8CYP8_MORAP|nr:Y box binding protein 1 [Mortierella alpina]KAG9325853.1 hypothetical protein KVV02_006847 [Mortierella alpina]
MSASNHSRKTGVVKFFNSQKGFGFIIPHDKTPDNPQGNSDEIFVHHTAIQNDGGFKSLAEGEEVEYDVVPGPKGMQAANVTGPNGVSVRGDPNLGRGGFGNNSGGRFGNSGGFNQGYGGFGGPNAYGGGGFGGMGNPSYGQGAGGQQGYGQYGQQHGYGAAAGFQPGQNQFQYGGYPQGGYGGANAGLQGQPGQQQNPPASFGPYGSGTPQAGWNAATPGSAPQQH